MRNIFIYSDLNALFFLLNFEMQVRMYKINHNVDVLIEFSFHEHAQAHVRSKKTREVNILYDENIKYFKKCIF